MTGKSHSALIVVAGLLASSASGSAFAAPAEPLVVSQLSDPDPNFVPPKQEPRKKAPRSRRGADEDAGMDQAMEKLGMIIGQAAQIGRQRQGATGEQIEAEKRQMMDRLREKLAGNQPN